jgi:hypothetical protein
MKQESRTSGEMRRPAIYLLALCLAMAGLMNAMRSPAAFAAGDDTGRIHLEPHLAPGQVFRYQLDLHTTAVSRAQGPISDAQGASTLERAALATVRLEVLSVELGSAGEKRVRLRATYEHCSAGSKSDALDVQEREFEKQFRKLEGASVEFSMDSDGRTYDFSAPSDSSLDPSTLLAMQQGTGALTPDGGLPPKGVAVGDKWSSEKEFQPSPLLGLYWHTDSAYLRNEPCPRPSPPPDAPQTDGTAAPSGSDHAGEAAQSDTCAVIQTEMKLIRRDTKGNQTPPDYIKNGLRTSGDWTGTGESISDISLRTGLVVTMTQTSSQEMNFRIATAEGRAGLQYTGSVQSQSAVTQLP